MSDQVPYPDLARHALFLDFDGTLAPIVARPEDAALPERMPAVLRALHQQTGGALAIVSGRALADLRPLLGDLALPLAGSHGHEIAADVSAAGDTSPQPLAPVLDAAGRRLEDVAKRFNLRMERKPGAVTLHYRGMPHLEEIVREAVTREARQSNDLKSLHGDMVSEVVLAAAGKGAAIEAFLAQPPFAGRLPVMIGDDVTDEDGFARAQALGGFGIKVGTAPSMAHHRIGSVEALADWLAALAGQTA